MKSTDKDRHRGTEGREEKTSRERRIKKRGREGSKEELKRREGRTLAKRNEETKSAGDGKRWRVKGKGGDENNDGEGREKKQQMRASVRKEEGKWE